MGIEWKWQRDRESCRCAPMLLPSHPNCTFLNIDCCTYALLYRWTHINVMYLHHEMRFLFGKAKEWSPYILFFIKRSWSSNTIPQNLILIDGAQNKLMNVFFEPFLTWLCRWYEKQNRTSTDFNNRELVVFISIIYHATHASTHVECWWDKICTDLGKWNSPKYKLYRVSTRPEMVLSELYLFYIILRPSTILQNFSQPLKIVNKALKQKIVVVIM